MIARFGFLVAASIATYAIRQISIKNSRSPTESIKPGANGEEVSNENWSDREDEVQVTYSVQELVTKGEKEEDEDQVKLISSVIHPASDNPRNVEDEEILPNFELEDFLSREADFLLSDYKFDLGTKSNAEKDMVYETEMAKNASELENLRSLVKKLEEREVNLEGELLEYYGLKEQESNITELQKQLRIKTAEIDMLTITINTLQDERKKLQQEVSQESSTRKELEASRNKIWELQRQIQLQANQTKGQLLLLKQQLSWLQEKEEEAVKNDTEVEKKLKAAKELEVEVMELKRKNKELQHEKRELIVKLDAAEAKVTLLSSATESELLAKARAEANNLKHTYEDLQKQVEGLQMNRFSEVEELVYLRWINACLRFELRNYQTPAGKASARDLSKSLSPRSGEKAKQLMLGYAGSERGQGETDVESNLSHPSSPGSEDFDNASIDSSTSKYSSASNKMNLIQKLKKWGKSKDEYSDFSSPTRSFSGGSLNRSSIYHRPKGPLEALMLRNAGDSMAITTFGKMEEDQGSPKSPGTPNLPHIKTQVSSSDSLNTVSASFQLMSKSVGGVLDDKYPAYKHRHKLALEREKKIKEKAEQARSEKFGDNSSLDSTYAPGTTVEREKPNNLPPKLNQIREKAIVSGDLSDQSSDTKTSSQIVNPMKLTDIEKRPPRVPRPPPKPSGVAAKNANSNTLSGMPPPPSQPPPPPPPQHGSMHRGTESGSKVHRAPELVEFYQTLMKREAKKDSASSMASSMPNAGDARSNMIGEIQNKSSFLLAVKADVETQGDFVQSLATEVRAASFMSIEDLLSFVNWLDEELSFLVDERAVLKHFDWPEGKADALREAAFEYQDLVKLENQVSAFADDPKIPCEVALKKMYSLLEKMEQSVYALLRTRDMAVSRYREFGIPVDWLSDSGMIGKIKLGSVQLARKYMKRVASVLDSSGGPEKEPNREFLLLQGVRFAFRVHQFAGGFDAESMKAFEELRNRISSQTSENNRLET